MTMVLRCVALVDTFGRSTSANIASTGAVFICPVIAIPVYLWHISSFSIVENETHDSHGAFAYSTIDLPVAM